MYTLITPDLSSSKSNRGSLCKAFVYTRRTVKFSYSCQQIKQIVRCKSVKNLLNRLNLLMKMAILVCG